MELFIYVIGITVVPLLAWIGFEQYRQRQELRHANLIYYAVNRELAIQAAERPAPQLFDQETQ